MEVAWVEAASGGGDGGGGDGGGEGGGEGLGGQGGGEVWVDSSGECPVSHCSHYSCRLKTTKAK